MADPSSPPADPAAAITALQSRLFIAEHENARLRRELDAVRRSASWRATGPARVLGRALGRRVGARRLAAAAVRDGETIGRSGLFDAAFYLGRPADAGEEAAAIGGYLAASRALLPRGVPHPGAPARRPVPGFHPLLYAAAAPGFAEAGGEDPLAHWIRAGRPAGPWRHDLIRPTADAAVPPGGLRVALHVHLHYPDGLPDLLARLARNRTRPDLVVTTGEAQAAAVRATLDGAGIAATVLAVPNRGRDMAPLLLHADRFDGYDVVGHLHGKRSPQQGADGERWLAFLLDHLVAPRDGPPVLDAIVAAFAADPALGLVFPEDANLNHWDLNGEAAAAVAARMGIAAPLPPHIEFPKGNMFWARPAALRPLAALGWRENDFPPEPLAGDGTLLHALERLTPVAAARAGFGYACVSLPGSFRAPG